MQPPHRHGQTETGHHPSNAQRIRVVSPYPQALHWCWAEARSGVRVAFQRIGVRNAEERDRALP